MINILENETQEICLVSLIDQCLKIFELNYGDWQFLVWWCFSLLFCSYMLMPWTWDLIIPT